MAIDKYNNFTDCEPRIQKQKRLECLKEIADQYGELAVFGIKCTYDWQNMHPLNMITAAKSRDWGK